MTASHQSCSVSQPQLVISGLGLERNGRWLFSDLHWEVPRGSFVAIVGPSGVGKSSLLSVIAGMLHPSAGETTFYSRDGLAHAPAEFHTRMGIVFQHLRLTLNTSLLNNVLCGRLGRYAWWQTLAGFPRQDRSEAFRHLQNLGIGHLAHHWAAEVSGGERQRTAIARALLQEPEVFLADEPVSNLDAYYAGRVLGILRSQAIERRATVFCVLHDAALVERFADHVLSLNPQDPRGWRIRQVQR